MSEFFNEDCMEGMKRYHDNYFALAIVDPPYGIGSLSKKFRSGSMATSRLKRYGGGENVSKANDLRPTKEYFDELFRVSRNQIVWGFNHLCDMLPPTTEFIFWYKHQPVRSYSAGELAWTSFTKTARCFDYKFFGAVGADKPRIHPTQKPKALYRWLLENYAEEGDIILDTHVGSGSSLIACEQLGFEYVGFEIDKGFYDKAKERLLSETAQLSFL